MNKKRQVEALKETIENMNFTKLKPSIEEIDRKLSFLYNHMEYDEYLDFIKSDKKLKNFDDTLGLFENNIIYTESMVNSLPEEFLKEIDEYVLNKIKLIGLYEEFLNYNPEW